jgi:hypothetical protein
MQLPMAPISAATSASWQHPVESCYAAKSNTGNPGLGVARCVALRSSRYVIGTSRA